MHATRLHRVAIGFWVSCAAVAQPAPPGQEPDPMEVTYPVVITPTRLLQSLADVPASVSVITGEMLQRHGIRSLPEALRLVPGMAVTQLTGSDYAVTYHGGNLLSARRMNVLIDGMSVYRPAFSDVAWTRLPLAIEDIDRIEVTRGPNSAAYGPNSMMAVVNIVTRHPGDLDRGLLVVSAGSPGSATVTLRTAFNLGDSAVSVTAERMQDPGFAAVALDPRGHDSLQVNRLNLRSQTRLDAASSLSLQAALVRGTAEVPYIDAFQRTDPDQRFQDSYLAAGWVRQLSPSHELQLRFNQARQSVRQSWRTCLPALAFVPELFDLWRANPGYVEALLTGGVPGGGSASDDLLALRAAAAIRQLGSGALSPTCGNTNQDAVQGRTELELQDTYVASEQLRLVGGLGLRRQRGDSQTYLGGSASGTVRWLFGNGEWRVLPWLSLNAGGYLERSSQSPTASFSPRVAANARLSPTQTLRLVVSRGTRSPDIFDQQADWTYRFTDLVPAFGGATSARLFQSRLGPGNLVSERITSRELGYLLNWQPAGLLLDLRVFDDRLTQLMPERTSLVGPPSSNSGAVGLRGAELQASVQWSPGASAFVNYAYLQNHDASDSLERTQYARHSGSLGLSRALGGGWRASLTHYGASGNGLGQSAYGRQDLVLSTTGVDADRRWQLSVGLSRLDHLVNRYVTGPVDVGFSRSASRFQGFVQFGVRLS